MNEFVNITEYPSYQINKLGEVRRIYKNGNIKSIKTSINKKNNYVYVSLHHKNHTLHRLLGKQFIYNPNNKPCIDHIDRNRQNNSLDNLRWVTYKENTNNKEHSKKGCICKSTEKYKDKTYIYFRVFWYENKIKKSKRFKTEEEAIKFNKNRII